MAQPINDMAAAGSYHGLIIMNVPSSFGPFDNTRFVLVESALKPEWSRETFGDLKIG